MSARPGRKKNGWTPIKGGLEAVYRRFDGVVLDALAAGIAHLVRSHVDPQRAAELFMARVKWGALEAQPAELMTHLEHLTARQIKRALLKRLRAVQQANNKHR